MNFWGKYYTKLLFPLVIMVGVLLFLILHQFISKIRAHRLTKFTMDTQRVMSLFSFVVVTLYTLAISTVVQPFNCAKQPDGSYLLTKSSNISCFNSDWLWHLPWVVIFMLVYGIAFPAVITYFFVKYRRDVNTAWFQSRFRSLVSPYSMMFFYWELVIMLKRSIFVVSNDFMSLSNSYLVKYFIGIGLLCAYLWIDVNIRPYRQDSFNTLACS
jgi:hypothetical protein